MSKVLRNKLGQAIELNTPVVVVTQGQGWVQINVGRVSNLKRVPVVTYIDGNKSAGLQRYERVFVISEADFAEHQRRFVLFRSIEDEFDTYYNPEPRNRWWNSRYSGHYAYADKDFQKFMNEELVRRGEEPWYEQE